MVNFYNIEVQEYNNMEKDKGNVGIGRRFGVLMLAVGLIFIALGMGEMTGLITLKPNPSATTQFFGMGMVFSGIGVLIVVFSFLVIYAKFAW